MPLSAIVSLLRPQSIASKRVSGAGAWSVRYARGEHPGFGLILEGRCALAVDGSEAIVLAEGDFVLLPAQPAFTLATDLALPPTLRAPAACAEVRHGDASGPATLRMLGGHFQLDPPNAPLLVQLLPPVIHIRRDAPGASRVRRVVELIAEATAVDEPGRELIVERLVEVLLVEALRLPLAGALRQAERGLLAGLADAALAHPLRHIHADLARRWTVAALARTAGMSRAVFAERFARVVGLPPQQYLLEWRMAIARALLRDGRPPLAEVAERVGYRSASAFSAAFARLTGHSPAAFRSSRSACRP